MIFNVDSRETKLPVWAKQKLREARMSGLVQWPPFPNPPPDYSQANGLTRFGKFPDSGPMFSLCSARFGGTSEQVKEHWAGSRGYIYPTPALSGSGYRADGVFWFDKKNAHQAAAWKTAEKCAEALLDSYSAALPSPTEGAE